MLSQFDDIEAEAERAANDWLEQNKSCFDPDHDDPSCFYETAYEKGIEFYQLLSDTRDGVRLSVVAGMFHSWDKQLRDWLVSDAVIVEVPRDRGRIASFDTTIRWRGVSASRLPC